MISLVYPTSSHNSIIQAEFSWGGGALLVRMFGWIWMCDWLLDSSTEECALKREG
jgi:hypothetical protein